MKHALIRINPKGESFIGRCVHCHKEPITLDAVEGCPFVTTNQDVIDAVEGSGLWE